MTAVQIAWAIATLVLALGIGRFIALVSLRLPAERPIAWSNSGCEVCTRSPDLAELAPIAGYLFRGGRCSDCGNAIPSRYPLIEAACVAIALWAVASVAGPLGFITAVLGWWLLLIAIVDAEHFWLPDRFTIPLAVFGLIAIAAYNPARLIAHIIGAVAGFAVLTLLSALYLKWRGKEGLGGGDARLLAAAGAWVGWMGLPTVLLWASLSGIVVVLIKALLQRRFDREAHVPFGAYLALGTWLTWLYGPIGGNYV